MLYQVVSETYAKQPAMRKPTSRHGPGTLPAGHRHWLLRNEGSVPWALEALLPILGI